MFRDRAAARRHGGTAGLRGVGGFLAERARTGSPMARTPRQKSQTRCIAARAINFASYADKRQTSHS